MKLSPAQQIAKAEREARAREREIAGPKKNKFNARRSQARDGRWFDSAKECARYEQLRDMERDGKIGHLECQPQFKLAIGSTPILIRSDRYRNGRQASVKFDFAYFDGKNRVIEDVKGGKATQTEAYKLRKAIVEAMYPMVRIVEVTR